MNSDDRSFLPGPSIYSEVMEKFKEQNMEEQTEINREELSFSFDGLANIIESSAFDLVDKNFANKRGNADDFHSLTFQKGIVSNFTR